MLNCISFDIEGFAESNAQSFTIDRCYLGRKKRNYEIEKNTSFILELLDSCSLKATFFVLGSVIYDLPHIIKQVAEAGHEIALHGPEHIRIFDYSDKPKFAKKLFFAKKILEDIIFGPVYGYRAADFSITESSIWALDILKQAGFLYDSSIYPFGFHDVYGIKNIKNFIHRLPNDLLEFPPATLDFFSMRFPFGGGGYFRLYPLFLTKLFLRKMNRRDIACMLYFHPYEVGKIIPDIPTHSLYRKFRHYYNCKNGGTRLKKFLMKGNFTSAINILSEHINISGEKNVSIG